MTVLFTLAETVVSKIAAAVEFKVSSIREKGWVLTVT